MNAMATGAIGRQRRAVLRRQPVITLEESLHPVGRQIVFGIQPLGSVAVAANIGGNLQRRAALKADDFVFGMTIGAGGRFANAFGAGLAMNAGLNIFGGLGMAFAAGHRQL